MAVKKFDVECSDCDTEYTISVRNNDEIDDPVACTFCGNVLKNRDITEEDDDGYDEESDDDLIRDFYPSSDEL